MKTNILLCAIALAVVSTGCVKDDLYESELCGNGAVVVVPEFPDRSEDVAAPESYVINALDVDYTAPTAGEYLIPTTFTPGELSLLGYNKPAGMTLADGRMNVNERENGTIEPCPEAFFVGNAVADVVKDETVTVAMPLMQRSYPIEFRFAVSSGDPSLLTGFTARLNGIARAFDMASQTVVTGNPAAIDFDIVKDDATAFYIGEAMILGVDGDKQIIELSFSFANGKVHQETADISRFFRKIGTTTEKQTIFAIIESLQEPDFEMSIIDWQLVEGEVEIK
ncbi:MAG: hypothetical protein ACI31A_02895 [Candidatus Limisoma sp.]